MSNASTNRRRSDGSPFTSARSSGENMTVRTTPIMSRIRGTHRPVDAAAVGAAAGDLHLEPGRTVGALHIEPDDGLLRAGPDERSIGGNPVGFEPGDVVDRFDQVGLALPVGADERGRPARQCDLGVRIRPEVVKLQVCVTCRSVSFLDGMAAELVAHGGDGLHGRRLLLAGHESGEQ